MMPNRRNLVSESLTVENGLLLASSEGTTPAMEYMLSKGIAHSVALRVLGGPKFRRQCKDRRKRQRD
jgi:hypothetical protein